VTSAATIFSLLREHLMPEFTILYDEPHEADWFRALHPDLSDAQEEAITAAKDWEHVRGVLAYDRPDIVLLDRGIPILVVEETVEVPSGHNVGQRFARIAAAAEAGVPCLYFGPYAAKKHGGATAGPRYMNLRLFHALDAMVRVTKTAITTINWPVDVQYEVRRDATKDHDVREYVATFLAIYNRIGNLRGVSAALMESEIQSRMLTERDAFIRDSVRDPEQYDGPPDSVELISMQEFHQRLASEWRDILPREKNEVALYNVGMTYIRSDPYTGMAILYRYHYILEHPGRMLVLWFPHISEKMWREVAARGNRKDIRLFRIAADAILFADKLIPRAAL